jgi:hypothetical protein
MSKNLVRRARVFARHLLTGLGAVGLFSASAPANTVPPAERLALESRVLAIRQAMQQVTRPAVEPDSNEAFAAAQWGNWGNWRNWANAWNNWGNWGNWGNWYNR